MPLYTHLSPQEWKDRIAFFRENRSPCNLCPRRCGAERSADKPGVCRAGAEVKVASYNLHFGEEPPISGEKGSGTVFFSGCTMKCKFCQNFPISHLFNGKYYSIEELAGIFLSLQERGALNINFVSPTPYLYHCAAALEIACKKGLRIPIVYNTSGYERVEIIKGLKNLVDIYLPDFKYMDNRLALRFSGVDDYVEHAYPAIGEMFAQVGHLRLQKNDECASPSPHRAGAPHPSVVLIGKNRVFPRRFSKKCEVASPSPHRVGAPHPSVAKNSPGAAARGLIIRHLLLPGFVENSEEVLKKIAGSDFRGAHLSLMSQYFPAHKAARHPELNRKVTVEEYEEVSDYALSLGFSKGWFQPCGTGNL